MGNIGGSLAHNYRLRNTPNADPLRLKNNEHDLKTAVQVRTAIEQRLPEKTRKNAVLAVEYLMTASPDWDGWKNKEKEKEFFQRAREWLIEKHGAENVISTSIHRDETTPHLVAYVVPIDSKGNLNCREFLGGKSKLSEMQTTFHNKVKHLGLNRGLEGSKAEHEPMQRRYAELQKPVNEKQQIHKAPLKTVTYNDSTIHALDAKSLKDEKLQKYFGTLFDEQHKHYQEQFLKAQDVLITKLSEQKSRADKEAESHKNAIEKIKSLERKIAGLINEFSQVAEFKKLFPDDYKEVEGKLTNKIEKHKNQLLRIKEEDARMEAQLRAHREHQARVFEQQRAEKLKNTLMDERKTQIQADREHLRSKVGECTTEPEKLAYIAIQSKLEGVVKEGFNHTALINNNEPQTNPYAEILRLMSNLEVYDFNKKLEIILNQCKDSKSKDYDDTYNSWGSKPSYFDNFDSSAKYIVAIQGIIDEQIQKGEASEKVNEAKMALSDVLVGKCKNEYGVLLSDEQAKERQRKYDEQVELSKKNQIDKGVYFEQEKKKGNDFEM